MAYDLFTYDYVLIWETRREIIEKLSISIESESLVDLIEINVCG